MNKYLLSVKKNNKIIHCLEKIEFDLDTSTNIVKQAENQVSKLLSLMHEKYSENGNYSWKVYSYNGIKYMSVTRSKNWIGD